MSPPPCVFASKVQQLLAVVEAAGFELRHEGKPVGGLAVSRPYLECALLAEGRRLEPAAAAAAAKADLLFCSSSSPSSSGLGVAGCAPCPLAPVGAPSSSSSSSSESGGAASSSPLDPLLPRDLGPALAKVLGPQAVSELKWARVPCVALLARGGCIPEAALAAAALAGVPVSPSLAGPHEEEVPTVVDMFLKAGGGGGNDGGGGNGSAPHQQQQRGARRYPDASLLILRDGGFLALGADIDEAAAAFARAARAHLLGEAAYAAVSEACGLPSAAGGPPSHASGHDNTEASAAGAQQQQQQQQAPTLDAFEGLGSGALLLGGATSAGVGGNHLGSHPLLLLPPSGGGTGNGHHSSADTSRVLPVFSLGGAATALRRLGHSLLGGRPTVGGRASDGAAEVISLGDTGGGAAGGSGGVARAGALRPSLPGVRGLFQGGSSGVAGVSPFALPAAGPPASSAGLPPTGASNGGRKMSGQMMTRAGSGAGLALARKGSETAAGTAVHRALPSFTSGGLKPW